MRKLLLLMTTLFIFDLQAGATGKMSHRSQGGDLYKRGRKRDQGQMPKYASFSGLDEQLGQIKNTTEARDRKRAHQEIVLLEYTAKPGSAEQFGAVKGLLEAGVSPEMRFVNKCNLQFAGSPLCNAAARGNAAVVGLLLAYTNKRDYALNPNALARYDMKEKIAYTTPLHAAARGREDYTEYDGHYEEVIRMLCQSGADANGGAISPELPFTPVHMVALQRVNRRSRDARKCEVLETARVKRQLSIMQALIDGGAIVSVLSYPERSALRGATAFEYAVRRKNRVLADFLRQAEQEQDEEIRTEFIMAALKKLRKEMSVEPISGAASKLHKARKLRKKFSGKLSSGAASSSQVLDDVDVCAAFR